MTIPSPSRLDVMLSRSMSGMRRSRIRTGRPLRGGSRTTHRTKAGAVALPVMNVKWDDVKAYIQWLRSRPANLPLTDGGGMGIRLPGGDHYDFLVGGVDPFGASELRWQCQFLKGGGNNGSAGERL